MAVADSLQVLTYALEPFSPHVSTYMFTFAAAYRRERDELNGKSSITVAATLFSDPLNLLRKSLAAENDTMYIDIIPYFLRLGDRPLFRCRRENLFRNFLHN